MRTETLFAVGICIARKDQLVTLFRKICSKLKDQVLHFCFVSFINDILLLKREVLFKELQTFRTEEFICFVPVIGHEQDV